MNAQFDLAARYLGKSKGKPSFPTKEKVSYKNPLVTVLVTYNADHVLLAIRHNQDKDLYLREMTLVQPGIKEGLTNIISPNLLDFPYLSAFF